MHRNRLGSAEVRYAFVAALSIYALVGVFSITGQAGQARSVTAGACRSAQATLGKGVYKNQCLRCYCEILEGVVGPPLTGNDFMANWVVHPVVELFDKSKNTMPQQAPATLTPAQSADLTAYI